MLIPSISRPVLLFALNVANGLIAETTGVTTCEMFIGYTLCEGVELAVDFRLRVWLNRDIVEPE